ncbi:hypothetical protein CN326_15095 [Bacillus sp. AFS018417]|nr:hypothetical protein CN326_15095 [Bacillus sp. AFS018417]
MLHQVLPDTEIISKIRYIKKDGSTYFDAVKHIDLEGMVAKSVITHKVQKFVYLEPKIQAKVKTRNWTRKGYLRTPTFVDFFL